MLKYGRGAVKGHPAVDKACFDGSGGHCIKMNFISVDASVDLSVIKGSGIIGLGPSPELFQDQELADPLEYGV